MYLVLFFCFAHSGHHNLVLTIGKNLYPIQGSCLIIFLVTTGTFFNLWLFKDGKRNPIWCNGIKPNYRQQLYWIYIKVLIKFLIYFIKRHGNHFLKVVSGLIRLPGLFVLSIHFCLLKSSCFPPFCTVMSHLCIGTLILSYY